MGLLIDTTNVWSDVAIKCDEIGLSDVNAGFSVRKRLLAHHTLNYASETKMITAMSGEAYQFLDGVYQRVGGIIKMFPELDFIQAMKALRAKSSTRLNIESFGGKVTSEVVMYLAWDLIEKEYNRLMGDE